MWHFPIASDGSVEREAGTDDPVARYRIRWHSDCRILSPFPSFTRMYRLDDDWVISFRPRSSNSLPRVPGWVAPAVSEVRIRIEGHELVPDIVITKLFEIRPRFHRGRARNIMTVGQRDAEGRATRSRTEFSTAGSGRAAAFVTTYWETGQAPGLEAGTGDPIYEFPELVTDGVIAQVEILYSNKTHPLQPAEPAFYIDAWEFFQRLADARRLQTHDNPNTEHRFPRSEAERADALQRPLSVHVSRDTSELPVVSDVHIVTGLQGIILHLPFSIGGVAIPPEIAVITQRGLPITFGAANVLWAEPVPLTRAVRFGLSGIFSGSTPEERSGAGGFSWSAIERYRPADQPGEYGIVLSADSRNYSFRATSSAIPFIRSKLQSLQLRITEYGAAMNAHSGYVSGSRDLPFYELLPLYHYIFNLQHTRVAGINPGGVDEALPPRDPDHFSPYQNLKNVVESFDAYMADLCFRAPDSLKTLLNSRSWLNDLRVADASTLTDVVWNLIRTLSRTTQGDKLIAEIFGDMLVASAHQLRPDLADFHWDWWVGTTRADLENSERLGELLPEIARSGIRRELEISPSRWTAAFTDFTEKCLDLGLEIHAAGPAEGPSGISLRIPEMGASRRWFELLPTLSVTLNLFSKIADLSEHPSADDYISLAGSMAEIGGDLIQFRFGPIPVMAEALPETINLAERVMMIADFAALLGIYGEVLGVIAGIMATARLQSAGDETTVRQAIATVGDLFFLAGLLSVAPPLSIPLMYIGVAISVLQYFLPVGSDIEAGDLVACSALGRLATHHHNPLPGIPVAGQIQLIDSLFHPMSISVRRETRSDGRIPDQLIVTLDATATKPGARWELRLFAFTERIPGPAGALIEPSEPPWVRAEGSRVAPREIGHPGYTIEIQYRYNGSAVITLTFGSDYIRRLGDIDRIEAFLSVAPVSSVPMEAQANWPYVPGFVVRADWPSLSLPT
jgi:hypothetical protein